MKRRARPAPTHAVITARDLDVLATLDWAHYLALGQLARLHFPSRRVAQRRLRALLDRGLVRAALQGGALHRDNLYVLSPSGARRLADDDLPRDRAPRPGRMPTLRALPHGLLVREVFVAFLGAEHEGRLRVDDFFFEGDLARAGTFAPHELVPDALAVLRVPGGQRRVAVEVDLGTEPLRVLEDKFRKYEAPLGARLVHEILLVASRGRRRLPEVLASAGVADGVRIVAPQDLRAVLADCSHGPYAPPLRAARTRAEADERDLQGEGGARRVAFRASQPVLRRIEAQGRDPLLLRVTRERDGT